MRVSLRALFDDLRVRPKLVILHNLFFLILAAAVYLSVIPAYAVRIRQARDRELNMVARVFAADAGRGDTTLNEALRSYDYRAGTSRDLGLTPAGASFLAARPDATWRQDPDMLFRRARQSALYRRVSISSDFYHKALRRAELTLFLVLGAIYVGSVLVLEFVIMPRYVYQPLRVMLRADEASQQGDRAGELIDDRLILKDEIGQIMRSRNETLTRLRMQEENLNAAIRHLEEQDRLVSLGLLSTSVAHELNTPLAVLQGSIEKLLECEQPCPTASRLERMLRVTQRLRRISESLLDFSRVRNERMEPVALHALVDESWSLVAIDEKAATVKFRNATSPDHLVIGNADRLIQVFVNLLRNALLAVPDQGCVRVESRLFQRGGRAWISCLVLDNGPGIPAHVLPNLFEAFVSTRLDARGTGLGLTVAEGIITQHGGTISASNRREGGASLEVVLPGAA